MSENTPIVSVLTTVFNREAFLAECIESVLLSNFKNWELIIVDDCSTDRSLEIAQFYASKDPRIKVYVNNTNLGDYPNRNKAASISKGKYIKYLDADDLIYKYSLDYMVEIMENNPDVDLALSHNFTKPTTPYPQRHASLEVLYSFFVSKNYLGVGPSEAIIRKSAFDKIGGFSGKRYIGDIELWVKLAQNSPIISLPPCLVYWREHENQQIVHERNDYKIIKVRHLHKIDVLNNIQPYLSKIQYKNALEFTQYRYARTFWHILLLKHKPIIAFELIKQSGLDWFTITKALWGFGKNKKKIENKHFI